MRMLFLPADPEADRLSLDGETLGWLKEARPTPYGGRPVVWGSRNTASSSALLIFDWHRDGEDWTTFLAVHRHGGMEVGIGNLSYDVHGTRVFPLRRMVGLAWIVAAMQVEAVDRWSLEPSFELTVAVRNARGSTLGMFAEGWKDMGAGLWEFPTCIEDHVLLRQEFDDAFDPETVALALGDRLENAFGSTHRRHVAYRGDFEGRFDPRF
jgi:hypothetical protein